MPRIGPGGLVPASRFAVGKKVSTHNIRHDVRHKMSYLRFLMSLNVEIFRPAGVEDCVRHVLNHGLVFHRDVLLIAVWETG